MLNVISQGQHWDPSILGKHEAKRSFVFARLAAPLRSDVIPGALCEALNAEPALKVKAGCFWSLALGPLGVQIPRS